MAKIIKLKTAGGPKFKYNIKKMLGKLPRSIKIGDIVKHLEAAGIPQHDFYRHQAIPLGSTKSISADDLLVYAQVFDCTTEELVNEPVRAKSIREAMSKRATTKTALR